MAFTTRNQWRKWLANHFQTKKEAWLFFPNKASGKKGIGYNDSVEEALCFGWIDSTVRNHGPLGKIQRFTPRRPKSPYSQANIERLKWLDKNNKLHPSVRKVVSDVIRSKFVFPPDILAAIRKNKIAWNNYRRFSPAYRRIRVAYINGARKRPEEFKRRLANFIKQSARNILIGYGGIEKHY